MRSRLPDAEAHAAPAAAMLAERTWGEGLGERTQGGRGEALF